MEVAAVFTSVCLNPETERVVGSLSRLAQPPRYLATLAGRHAAIVYGAAEAHEAIVAGLI
jgi:hypothetical protein